MIIKYMSKLAAGIAAGLLMAACATTSAQEQRQAQIHQAKSDDAGKNARYGIAGEEQRQAADSHHRAVKKALAEGTPVPTAPKAGDPAPLAE